MRLAGARSPPLMGSATSTVAAARYPWRPTLHRRVLQTISPHKDVDGFHAFNVGAMARHGEERRRSGAGYSAANNSACTPLGCVELLDRSGVDLEGAEVSVPCPPVAQRRTQ